MCANGGMRPTTALLLLLALSVPFCLESVSACNVFATFPQSTNTRTAQGDVLVCGARGGTQGRALVVEGDAVEVTQLGPGETRDGADGCTAFSVALRFGRVGGVPLVARFGEGCVGSSSVFVEGVELRRNGERVGTVEVAEGEELRLAVVVAEGGKVVEGRAALDIVEVRGAVVEGNELVFRGGAGGKVEVVGKGGAVDVPAYVVEVREPVKVVSVEVVKPEVLSTEVVSAGRVVRVVLAGARETVERRLQIRLGGEGGMVYGVERSWDKESGVVEFDVGTQLEGRTNEDLKGARFGVQVAFQGGRTVGLDVGEELFAGFEVEPTKVGVKVALAILLSAWDADQEEFVLPVVCGRVNVPVVLATVSGESSLPVYAFQWRVGGEVSEMEKAELGGGAWVAVEAGDDKSNLVAVDQTGLFSDAEGTEGYVEVRCVATVDDGRVGEVAVRINRRLRPDAIGVTVLAPELAAVAVGDGTAVCLASDAAVGKPAVVEGSFSSAIHCPNPADLEQVTEWSVNGRTVSVEDSIAGAGKGSNITGPVQLGFGSGVVLPAGGAGDDTNGGDDNDNVKVRVVFTDTATNQTLGIGESIGNPVQRAGSARPAAQINSGEGRVAVAPGATVIVGGMDADSTATSGGEDEDGKAFVWSCRVVGGGACGNELLPSEPGRVFNVTAPSNSGALVEYSLQITAAGVESRVARMVLAVVDGAGGDAFLPGGKMLAGDGRSLVPTNPCRSTLMPYEELLFLPPPAFLASDFNRERELSYALFADGGEGEDLLKDTMLVRHDGYWTNAKKENRLFGLNANTLAPGKYTLVGSPSVKVGSVDGPGSAWQFVVAETPELSVSRLPVTNGTATETLFHAAASSSPAGFLFYFALRKSRLSNPLESPITAKECLGGCSGARAVSFLVPEPGEYFVQVDMIGSTSEVVASAMSPNSFVVGESAVGTNSDVALDIQAARSQNDETAFLLAVERYGDLLANGSSADVEALPSMLAVNASRGLRTLAETSVLTPMRATKVIGVGSGLLGADISTDLVNNLDDASQMAVLRVVQTKTGPQMPGVLTSFYSRATERVAAASQSINMAARQADEEGSSDSSSDTPKDSTALLAQLRGSSTAALTGATARGRECGFTYDSTNAAGTGSASDIKTTCYPGQFESVQACTSQSSSPLATSQSDALGISSSDGAKGLAPDSEEDVDDRLWSPVLTVDGFRQGATGTRVPVDTSCINVTVPFEADKEMRDDLDDVFAKELRDDCPNAISVFQRRKGDSKVSKVSPLPEESKFVKFTEKGNCTFTFAAEPGQEIFGSLDKEELRKCFALDGTGPKQWVVILGTLLIATALLALFAWCAWFGKHRRSERAAVMELSKPAEGIDVDGLPVSVNKSMGNSSLSSKVAATESSLASGEFSRPGVMDHVVMFDEESGSEGEPLTDTIVELAGVPDARTVERGGEFTNMRESPLQFGAASRGGEHQEALVHDGLSDPPLVPPSMSTSSRSHSSSNAGSASPNGSPRQSPRRAGSR